MGRVWPRHGHRGRPLNSVVRHQPPMNGVGVAIAAVAVASSFALKAGAVCLDERGISGYHIPLEKEFRTAHVVAIGTVVAEREVPAPFTGSLEGTSYRFKIEETLRGRRYKTLDLFSENTSGRFPMDVGHRYLVFVGRHRRTFSVSNCGSSGELPEQSHILAALRKKARDEGKG